MSDVPVFEMSGTPEWRTAHVKSEPWTDMLTYVAEGHAIHTYRISEALIIREVDVEKEVFGNGRGSGETAHEKVSIMGKYRRWNHYW